MPLILNYWGDGSTWGDGDLYSSPEALLEYGVEYEARAHRVGVRLTYTSEVYAGALAAFVIHAMRLRVGERQQQSFSHEVFVDTVAQAERVSLKVSHAASEFIISSMQLVAQRKRKQPKG